MLKLPSSPITDLLTEMIYILPDKAAVETYIKRNQEISKNKSTMRYECKGNSLIVHKKTSSEQIHLGFNDYHNTPSSKMLQFLLYQINKLAIVDAKVVTDTIEFNVNELVQFGMYQSVTSAKAALPAIRRLTDIHYYGTVKFGNDKIVSEWQCLIKKVELKKQKVKITLNSNFPWDAITQYYMQLPEESFALSTRAFLIMYLCCFIVRQKITKIKSDGFLSITLKTVQCRLNLPDENQTKNPKAVIKQPIKNIVDEINALNCGIKLKLFANEKENITSFLYNGKINIYLDESAKASLPDIKKPKKK